MNATHEPAAGEIVVGVDGSAGAAAALQWAVHEAGLRNWSVTAVLAWGLLDQFHLVGDEFDPHYCDSDAEAALDAAVGIAIGIDAARRVRRRVVCDLPARALVEQSRTADLLAVGARGLDGFRSLLLGSVSDQCAHHAVCPVVIVPTARSDGRLVSMVSEPPATVSERVVVGIDASETAQRALGWAVTEARLRHATLDVVHAWQFPLLGQSAAVAPTTMSDIEAEAEHILATALKTHDTEGLPPVRRLLFNGSPAAAILETAQGADLVVVGSRGQGGFRSLLLGSTSRQVAHHAPCPVVIVPGSADRDDDGA
jgi:nucleotide-binding universal stress UspA family protein